MTCGGNHLYSEPGMIIIPHAYAGAFVSGSMSRGVNCFLLGNYLDPGVLGRKDSLWFTEQIFTQIHYRSNCESRAQAFGRIYCWCLSS